MSARLMLSCRLARYRHPSSVRCQYSFSNLQDIELHPSDQHRTAYRNVRPKGFSPEQMVALQMSAASTSGYQPKMQHPSSNGDTSPSKHHRNATSSPHLASDVLDQASGDVFNSAGAASQSGRVLNSMRSSQHAATNGYGLQQEDMPTDMRPHRSMAHAPSSLQIPDQHPIQPLLDVLDSPVTIEAPGSPGSHSFLGNSSRGMSHQPTSMLRMSSHSSPGSPPPRHRNILRQSSGEEQASTSQIGLRASPNAAFPSSPIRDLRDSHERSSGDKWGDSGEGMGSGKSARKVQRALFENQQPGSTPLDWSIPATPPESGYTSSLHYPVSSLS